jgi:osmotically inducible protein OsmC
VDDRGDESALHRTTVVRRLWSPVSDGDRWTDAPPITLNEEHEPHRSPSISRRARATWKGTVEAGEGQLALGSGAFTGEFTLRARVEDVARATNPEELLGAASAGCFTMSLSSMLADAGTPVTDIETTAHVRLEQRDEGFRITRILLSCVGEVPGVDERRFVEAAEQAKATCPVSLALAGTEIVLEARLV